MMFGLGPAEIALIMGVLLLLFGAKRLPQLARGLGQSIGEFRRSLLEPDRATDDRSDDGNCLSQKKRPAKEVVP